ncbi:alpha/beta hydrolase [Rheinheimera sp.]|uniref:alpha/beta hydrolase n=1 Tax=Rheinheimera sp. TaxID=1869214 RepID=UPI00307CDE6A
MQLIPWQYQTQYGFSLRGYTTQPRGLPLLHVLHGNGFCSRMYQPLLELLYPQFDLFLSDAQGHGDSDHGGHFVGWNESAELALDAFLAHRHKFGNVPCYAVGHSFGAVLTALINSRSDSPFQKAVLLDPVLFSPLMLGSMRLLDWIGLYRHNPMAKKARKRRASWPDRQHAWNYLHQRGMFKGWHDDALAAYIDHALQQGEAQFSLKCPPSREADIFASYPKGLWTALKKPCSPSLLLYGDKTYSFVTKSARKWALVNPAVQLIQVKGGHCFMQEDPSTSAALIQTFLTPSDHLADLSVTAPFHVTEVDL